MIESIYLRLSSPLQSWAGLAITGNIVRTQPFPTRSGLQGLVAGALGAQRDLWPEWLNEIEFWIRQDKKPRIVDDFHTINPRPESNEFRRRLLLAQGMKARGQKAVTFTPDAQGGTSVVNRTYLSDGEFLVRVTCQRHTNDLEDALSSPAFATYLGRKAFPAHFPFYLGRGASDVFEQIPTLATAEGQNQRPLTFVKLGPHLPPGGQHSQGLVATVTTAERRYQVISDLLTIRRPTL